MPSPKYVRPPPGGLASPVPAHRSPLGACAIAPMFCTFASGQTDVQFVPPSVVFQMPPPDTAAKALFGVKRSATTSVTRPPMLYGPICFQLMPLAAGATAAACARSRLIIAVVGAPYLRSARPSVGS